MKKKRDIICFSIVAILIAVNVPTQGMAGESQQKADSPFGQRSIPAPFVQTSCYESPKYLIISREVRGKAGSDILIKYKSMPHEKFPCTYSVGKADFEVKNEWAEYFAGLKEDLLILDSSTGPGPSGLTIWDMAKRKKVFEGSWSAPEESGSDSLVYWLETGEAGDDNCPQLRDWRSKGLEAAIETKVILSLSSFTITGTPETRCSPRQ